jgi:phosphoglycolate phosphatase
MPTRTIAFDLDMTLIDSRPGIARSLAKLVAATGRPIDIDLVLSRLGPKLEDELGCWFPAAEVSEAARQYRAIYWDECLTGTLSLPGAPDALDAARAGGGRAVIVTAKVEAAAKRCLDHLDLPYDAIVGHAFGPEKTAALQEFDAAVYVGDTITDVEAGVAAGAIAVGVTTGPDDASALRSVGAAHVFESLVDVGAWLRALT